MIVNKRITDEDLLITEKLIAGSYGLLKRSVIQVPLQVYDTIDETVRKHPLGAVISAIFTGGIVYEVISLIYPCTSALKSRDITPDPIPVKQKTTDFNQEIMMMIIPLVTPFIVKSIQDYLEDNLPREVIKS
jgi:hypothetical protein